MNKKLLLFLYLCLLFAGQGMNQEYDTSKLNAIKLDKIPVIDGVVDDLWKAAPGLSIALGEPNNSHDPASIMDCEGCHKRNSKVTVILKAVYSTDNICFLASWPDPNASLSRGGSWSFADHKWQKLNPGQSEDRISFFWPIGKIAGDPYDTGGCMAKCHAYYPPDTDPHVSKHGIIDDAWLKQGRADVWHSKAARGAAYFSASGLNLTIDSATHEVTKGTFSMIGFMDDKYVDEWKPDAENGEDGGRFGDAGTSAYSHNRISDKSRPKYMEKTPIDYADAMILKQSEIDSGECVGNPDSGVSAEDAAKYWQAYKKIKAIVPERILRLPVGSRVDIKIGAVWNNGFWTVEITRPLNTGNLDDIQFEIAQEYLFGIAIFENSRHGYEHKTSAMYFLKFN